jgi:type 1 fimbria pilin
VNKISKIINGALALLTLSFSAGSFAYTCTTSDGHSIGPGGSQTPVEVRVRIGPVLKEGKNEIINVSQINCRNDYGNIIDYLDLDANGATLTTSLFKNVAAGITVNGSDYLLNSLPKISNLQTLTRLQSQSIPLSLYIMVVPYPTPDITIKRGDKIGQINFSQRNNMPDCPQRCGPYRWSLIADNDAYFVTTSCTINNGQQINVDFGPIRQDLLSNSPTSTNFKQDKNLTYNCDDTTKSMDMAVRLVSDPSAFSTDLIRTTNSDVGIAMLYKGNVVTPNQTFSSKIINGVGNDTISFVPVKNGAVSYQNIATGDLTGSATLIFSAP